MNAGDDDDHERVAAIQATASLEWCKLLRGHGEALLEIKTSFLETLPLIICQILKWTLKEGSVARVSFFFVIKNCSVDSLSLNRARFSTQNISGNTDFRHLSNSEVAP